jgi:hypothetical protein
MLSVGYLDGAGYLVAKNMLGYKLLALPASGDVAGMLYLL